MSGESEHNQETGTINYVIDMMLTKSYHLTLFLSQNVIDFLSDWSYDDLIILSSVFLSISTNVTLFCSSTSWSIICLRHCGQSYSKEFPHCSSTNMTNLQFTIIIKKNAGSAAQSFYKSIWIELLQFMWFYDRLNRLNRAPLSLSSQIFFSRGRGQTDVENLLLASYLKH